MTSNESGASEFIGRRQEMAVLSAALADALAGKGQLVMISGEPGIGKTRLVQQAAAHAASSGFQVLSGWCYEHGGAPPYWPFAQPIRHYIAAADLHQLRSQIGTGGPEIAEIVPELREKLPDLGIPQAADPDQARFRLFDSVATFLKNASQSQPMVFVVDDLHWADESSLLLLEFLMKEIATSPLLILCTFRDVEVTGRHPLTQTLGNLFRERHFQRVHLSGLSQQEVGEVVEANTGFTLPNEALETVHRRTEGNPLFVNAVVELTRVDQFPDHFDENGAWASVIPDGVRDAIGRRLARLSDRCNHVLRTASVIGREFDFPLLWESDIDFGSDGVLEALDEALEAKVIETLPYGLERYQFGHALIQQALYEDLSTVRRVQVHAKIGEILEQSHRANLGEHAAEMAHHFAEAAAVLGPEKVSRYSLMAGERALDAYAHEDALRLFTQRLAAKDLEIDGTSPPQDEDGAALLFGQARALSAASVYEQLVRSFAALRRAFEYYVDAGNVALAVAVAEFPVAPAPARIPGIAEVMARALTLVPEDSHEAGRLLSRYGGILGLADGDYEGAKQAMERAIAIARRDGDLYLEIQTLAYAVDVSRQNLQWQESIDNGLRAIELSTGDEKIYSKVLPRWWTTVSLLHLGMLEAARAHSLVLRDLTEERSTPRLLTSISFVPIITLSCLEGDWQTAREYVDRGINLSPLHQQLLGIAVLLEHETGEVAQGEIYLDQLVDAANRQPTFFATGRTSMAIAIVSRMTGVTGRLDIAKELSESVLSDRSATPALVMYAKAGLALVAVQNGDRSTAGELHAYFLGQRGTMLWTAISVDRLLGLLSHTMGDPGQSAAHFEDALAFCRNAAYGPELAWTCSDYAECLLNASTVSGKSEPGNSANTTVLLDEALAISSDLGMRPLMERVAALQERTQAQPVGAPAYAYGLTQREVEVLLLIAQGKTTREIATELVLSARTVQRHISNLYSKINVRNRVEATAFAQTEPSIASQAPHSAS